MAANNRALALATFLVAAAAVPVANATLSQAATFDEKVANAAAIVVGKVVRKESHFDASKRWILTYTTFKVEKTLKGGAPAEVTIVTPGGQVNGIHQSTIGTPVFTEGQENVVFIRNTTAGPTVLYLDQGAYEVRQDERGERIVAPVESGAVRIDTQRGMAVEPEEPRTLRDFESAVRAAEHRARANTMQLMKQQQRQKQPESSYWRTVADNAFLIGVAILGLALATLHFLRR